MFIPSPRLLVRKVNVIARLEFELTFYNVTVPHVNFFAASFPRLFDRGYLHFIFYDWERYESNYHCTNYGLIVGQTVLLNLGKTTCQRGRELKIKTRLGKR